MSKQRSKTLIYDIETSYLLTKTWGIYQADVIGQGQGVIEESQILCFAYKWLDDKKTHVVAQPDFRGYKKGVNDDRHVVKRLWELFNEAEVVIGHNSDSFDNKIAQARMVYHKLPPPFAYQKVDTKKIAKRYFRFTSNKLADLASFLGVEAKGDPGGISTWDGCIAGDPKAWKRMTKYNKQDVVVTEQIYKALRGWVETHPNMALISDQPDACRVCGDNNGFYSAGFKYTTTKKYRYWACKSCHAKTKGKTEEKV